MTPPAIADHDHDHDADDVALLIGVGAFWALATTLALSGPARVWLTGVALVVTFGLLALRQRLRRSADHLATPPAAPDHAPRAPRPALWLGGIAVVVATLVGLGLARAHHEALIAPATVLIVGLAGVALAALWRARLYSIVGGALTVAGLLCAVAAAADVVPAGGTLFVWSLVAAALAALTLWAAALSLLQANFEAVARRRAGSEARV